VIPTSLPGLIRGKCDADRIAGCAAFPWRSAWPVHRNFPGSIPIRAFVLPSPSWIARRLAFPGLPCHAEQAPGLTHETFALRSSEGS
jgi:hypothetical protein